MEVKFDISNKIKLIAKLNFHYQFYDGVGLFLIKIENFCDGIIKDRHLKTNTYLKLQSLGITNSLWRDFCELTSKIHEKTGKTNWLAESTLIHFMGL